MADTTVSTAVSSVLDDRDVLWGPYWVSPSIGYIIYVNSYSDLSYARTTNSGNTWSLTTIEKGTCVKASCWFDKETPDISGNKLHITWLDSATNDCYYRNLDLSTNTLGTKRTVDSTITVDTAPLNNRICITKSLSGNILVAFSTQTEIECYKSTDEFATSPTNISDVYETATEEDYCLLFPANTGDNNDAAAIFWDRSANIISLKMYDDSANSWSETTIASSVFESINYRNIDGAVRHSDNHILIAFHSNDDTTTDDLMTYDLTPNSIASPTVTAKTNVFTDQAESAQVGIIINQQNDDVYVAHLKGGTWLTSVDVVFHKSTDDMSTWGTEQSYSEAAADDNRLVSGGRTVGNAGGRIQWVWYNDDLTDLFINEVNDIEISSTGRSHSFNGVSNANISSINGISKSNINKVNGVQ